MRLIDADSIEFYYGGLSQIAPNDFIGIAKYFYKQIQEMPTVDPLIHGKWRKRIGLWSQSGYVQICSVCEKQIESLSGNLKFCPNCGAKMDLKETE